MPASALMNWSGGKDSALALYEALRTPQLRVDALLTSVNQHYRRVSMHGVRLELLREQARQIGLPLTLLELPEAPDMATYEACMQATLAPLQRQGITHAVFGDLHLQDLRQYREQQLARLGWRAEFPLWQRPNADLLRQYLDLGFRAVVVCVNEQHLDRSFCGRLLDEDFLRDLPPGVDSCGENGEYHTFVFEAPYFRQPIPFTKGEVVRRTYPAPAGTTPAEAGFWYCDLLPAGEEK
ncbi:Dph6-related ATP pyrophosphatase [Hymenobacter weizhouensis]|uniref:Dph6-related ATP pyrophosphatase n=1 Tax=Hymenobacter sp. YIM 151500-1 TaxID=2987689 RepID=UPI0022277CA8|nr:ATP-binding protein [Hymenobacter sp. YIM 151500-1]UYZ63445.1 ATP-binding protein [Hymenobacter sp. YIM 151500-1]